MTALIVITLRECENTRFHYFDISTICQFDKTTYVSLILIIKNISGEKPKHIKERIIQIRLKHLCF